MNTLKPIRNIVGMILMLCAVLAICTSNASADVNLMDNGSVQIAYVKDEDDLRAYIDHDGLYASQNDVAAKEFTDSYRIIIDEPGELIICALCDYTYPVYQTPVLTLYSDFQLTSSIAKINHSMSDRDGMLHVTVEPGKYYYRSTPGYMDQRRTDGKATLTVYVGFVPASGTRSEHNNPSDMEVSEATPENSVEYSYVASDTEFIDLMDHNVKASSRDTISDQENQSEIHSIRVTEPGTLVFCLVADYYHASYVSSELRVFSNAQLTSLIGRQKGYLSNRMDFLHVKVCEGTYYYLIQKGYKTHNHSVYIGFIPDTVSTESVNIKAGYQDDIEDLTIFPVFRTRKEFEDFVSEGREATFTDELKPEEYSNPRAIDIPEDGILCIYTFTENAATTMSPPNELYMYTNSDLTIRYHQQKYNSNVADNMQEVYVDPGKYYLQSIGGYSSGNGTHLQKTYLGFIPSTSVISVNSIRSDETTGKKIVTFNIADEYNPDQSLASVRIVPGKVFVKDIDNKDIWHFDTMENAIESHEFVAPEDGIYTARISGNGLRTFLLVFEVPDETDTIQEADPVPETTPEPTPEPVPTSVPEATSIPASELRKYIRMLEDMIDECGLVIPDSAAELTQTEYVSLLEQILQENGIDF